MALYASDSFSFGLAAAAIWPYILTPLQTATLIIWFAGKPGDQCGGKSRGEKDDSDDREVGARIHVPAPKLERAALAWARPT
jgi:hypothetical protein